MNIPQIQSNSHTKQLRKNKNKKIKTKHLNSNLIDSGFINLSSRDSIEVDNKDNEELALEYMLFGNDVKKNLTGNEINAFIEENLDNNEEIFEDEESLGFTIDNIGTNSIEKNPTVDNKNDILDIEPATKEKWIDDDDDLITVNIATLNNRTRKLRAKEEEETISGKEYEKRLRQHFNKIHPIPNWAKVEDDYQETEGDLSFLRQNMGIFDSSKVDKKISSDFLDILRLKDANQTSINESMVTSAQFHPSAPILLTSGFDKTLKLFQIDGKLNQKIATVGLKDMPIHKALFTADGKEVICVGRRKFFYTYNLETGTVEKTGHVRGRDEKSFEKHYISPCNRYIVFIGSNGYIILCCRKSKQWIANLKMNTAVKGIEFSKDGSYLISFGAPLLADGEIYQWDMDTRTCIHKFYDEGAVKPTSLSLSNDGNFFATGSSTGVVNLYSSSSCFLNTPANPNFFPVSTENLKNNPSPLKAIFSLTTDINIVKFHPSSQILAISSFVKRDCLRMVHLPSMSVFPNWPTAKTPLGHVNCMNFSPNGGYFALGNDKGKVLLYKLNDFSSY
ncbi:U3 small nucleolar RNA-associated protein 18 [Clydaea vesicula]|uniref:U3 small nucleolar RNA-associated protein 18 homolog n=1 Tax=Clydaea vesicula TaxID=447962 RepID=A0AAD5U3X6_9FUNG|nr:U3 small nucleolar RNA-associated protein 18 [Clydaea vesicula]